MLPVPDLAAPDLAALAAGLLCFVTLVFVWRGADRKDVTARRVRQLGTRRAALRREALVATSGQLSAREIRRKARSDGLRARLLQIYHIGQSLKLIGESQVKQKELLLLQAGYYRREALSIYAALKLLLPLAGLAVGLVIAFVVRPFDEGAAFLNFVAIGGCALIGSVGIDVVLKRRVKTRVRAVADALPDALDLMVVCVESGLGLDATMDRVSREIRRSAPTMAEEMSITVTELTFLPNRSEAFDNFIRRVDLNALRSVLTTIQQSERYGTSLAHSLRVLAIEMRRERLLLAEQKAARLPATLAVPLIMFVLPALFVVLIGPAIVNVFDAFKTAPL